MKKILAVLVAAAVLAGCGQDAEDPLNAVPLTSPERVTVTVDPPLPSVTIQPPATVDPPPAPTTVPPEAPQAGVLPDVVGLDHQLAQDTLQAAGYYNLSEEDATGQNRLLLVDRNWVVVEQVPAAGTSAPSNTAVLLRSKKFGE